MPSRMTSQRLGVQPRHTTTTRKQRGLPFGRHASSLGAAVLHASSSLSASAGSLVKCALRSERRASQHPSEVEHRPSWPAGSVPDLRSVRKSGARRRSRGDVAPRNARKRVPRMARFS